MWLNSEDYYINYSAKLIYSLILSYRQANQLCLNTKAWVSDICYVYQEIKVFYFFFLICIGIFVFLLFLLPMHFFQNKVFTRVFEQTWNVQNLIFFYPSNVFGHAKVNIYYVPDGVKGQIYFQFPVLFWFSNLLTLTKLKHLICWLAVPL